MESFTLDHVVIAVRDMDIAAADYSALLGRNPSWAGSHPLYGTRNTLFRLDNMYVELLAVSGARAHDKRWAEELTRFLDEHGEGPYALALGTRDISEAMLDLRARSVEVQDPADGAGIDDITGAQREWRNAMVPAKSTRGMRVFFIEHRSPPGALPTAPPQGLDIAAVRRMDHAVVLSADMEATRRFWDGQLGARLALDRTFPERNARILFFRLGDITVEVSGGAQQTEEGLGKPDRLWGLAWGVDDLHATCTRLDRAGIETSGPRPGIKPGTLVATVKGPQTHGVATLLIEHTPESFKPESRAPQGQAYDNEPERRAFTAKALDHVVLATADLDATAEKWRGVLGMRVTETIEPEGSHLRLAKIPAGNTFIELAQALTPDHRVAERGPGMFSIAVEVDDLDAAVADLRSKGVPVSEPEAGVWPETRIARINRSAANGVSIQLIQRS
jgi:catechol 2,3-dioxygenase-like lactoylglutathione lyase family enzyme